MMTWNLDYFWKAHFKFKFPLMLASLNILVEVATQMGEEEPEIENILEFNEEVCTMTPKSSQDTDLIEMESQQQENEEVNQDVATQEPTFL